MGTFIGHVLPGTIFAAVAIWHAINTINNYFKSMCSNGSLKFKSSPYFLSCGYPVESICKFVICMTGMIVARILGHFVPWFYIEHNIPHMIMYFFFANAAFWEILHAYACNLPPYMCYMANIIAFAAEAIMFYFHGRNDLDDFVVHMTLIGIVVAICLTTCIEMCQRHWISACLCRQYFLLLSGLWLNAIAFLICGDEINLGAPTAWSKYISIFFVACVATALCIMLIIWFTIAFKYKALWGFPNQYVQPGVRRTGGHLDFSHEDL